MRRFRHHPDTVMPKWIVCVERDRSTTVHMITTSTLRAFRDAAYEVTYRSDKRSHRDNKVEIYAGLAYGFIVRGPKGAATVIRSTTER